MNEHEQGVVGKHYVEFGRHRDPAVTIPIIASHGKVVGLEAGKYVVEEYDLADPSKASVKRIPAGEFRRFMLQESYKSMRSWYVDMYLPAIKDELRRIAEDKRVLTA